MGPRGPKGARGETGPQGVIGLPGVPGSKVSELFSLLIDMPMGVTLDVRTCLRCLHEYLYTYTIIIHILQHLTSCETGSVPHSNTCVRGFVDLNYALMIFVGNVLFLFGSNICGY